MIRAEEGLSAAILLAVALLSAAIPSVLGAEPVAAGLVLAVTGPAFVKATPVDRPLAPMALIDRGETIATGRDGTVTVLFFPDGRAYTLTPGSSARLGERAVNRLTGSVTAAAKGVSAPALPKTPRLTSRRVAGEIVRAESPYVGFLTPPPNGSVRDTTPEYRWALARPRHLSRLTISDAAGRELASRDVRGDRVGSEELGVPLVAGGEYVAQLVAVDASGAPDLATLLTAPFRVLTSDEAQAVDRATQAAEAARQADPPSLAATFELLFLLTELRLYPQAVAVAELLREQMPDNPHILRYLALAYRESGQRAASNDLLREAEKIAPAGGG